MKKKKNARKRKRTNDIRQIIEYWFSKANLAKKRHHAKYIQRNQAEGIPILHLLKSTPLRKYKNLHLEEIHHALKKSSTVKISKDGQRITTIKTIPSICKQRFLDALCIVYVENIPQIIDEAQVRKCIAKFVRTTYIKIPKHKYLNCHRGYAFVYVPSPSHAKTLCELLNGAWVKEWPFRRDGKLLFACSKVLWMQANERARYQKRLLTHYEQHREKNGEQHLMNEALLYKKLSLQVPMSNNKSILESASALLSHENLNVLKDQNLALESKPIINKAEEYYKLRKGKTSTILSAPYYSVEKNALQKIRKIESNLKICLNEIKGSKTIFSLSLLHNATSDPCTRTLLRQNYVMEEVKNLKASSLSKEQEKGEQDSSMISIANFPPHMTLMHMKVLLHHSVRTKWIKFDGDGKIVVKFHQQWMFQQLLNDIKRRTSPLCEYRNITIKILSPAEAKRISLWFGQKRNEEKKEKQKNFSRLHEKLKFLQLPNIIRINASPNYLALLNQKFPIHMDNFTDFLNVHYHYHVAHQDKANEALLEAMRTLMTWIRIVGIRSLVRKIVQCEHNIPITAGSDNESLLSENFDPSLSSFVMQFLQQHKYLANDRATLKRSEKAWHHVEMMKRHQMLAEVAAQKGDPRVLLMRNKKKFPSQQAHESPAEFLLAPYIFSFPPPESLIEKFCELFMPSPDARDVTSLLDMSIKRFHSETTVNRKTIKKKDLKRRKRIKKRLKKIEGQENYMMEKRISRQMRNSTIVKRKDSLSHPYFPFSLKDTGDRYIDSQAHLSHQNLIQWDEEYARLEKFLRQEYLMKKKKLLLDRGYDENDFNNYFQDDTSRSRDITKHMLANLPNFKEVSPLCLLSNFDMSFLYVLRQELSRLFIMLSRSHKETGNVVATDRVTNQPTLIQYPLQFLMHLFLQNFVGEGKSNSQAKSSWKTFLNFHPLIAGIFLRTLASSHGVKSTAIRQWADIRIKNIRRQLLLLGQNKRKYSAQYATRIWRFSWQGREKKRMSQFYFQFLPSQLSYRIKSSTPLHLTDETDASQHGLTGKKNKWLQRTRKSFASHYDFPWQGNFLHQKRKRKHQRGANDYMARTHVAVDEGVDDAAKRRAERRERKEKRAASVYKRKRAPKSQERSPVDAFLMEVDEKSTRNYHNSASDTHSLSDTELEERTQWEENDRKPVQGGGKDYGEGDDELREGEEESNERRYNHNLLNEFVARSNEIRKKNIEEQVKRMPQLYVSEDLQQKKKRRRGKKRRFEEEKQSSFEIHVNKPLKHKESHSAPKEHKDDAAKVDLPKEHNLSSKFMAHQTREEKVATEGESILRVGDPPLSTPFIPEITERNKVPVSSVLPLAAIEQEKVKKRKRNKRQKKKKKKRQMKEEDKAIIKTRLRLKRVLDRKIKSFFDNASSSKGESTTRKRIRKTKLIRRRDRISSRRSRTKTKRLKLARTRKKSISRLISPLPMKKKPRRTLDLMGKKILYNINTLLRSGNRANTRLAEKQKAKALIQIGKRKNQKKKLRSLRRIFENEILMPPRVPSRFTGKKSKEHKIRMKYFHQILLHACSHPTFNDSIVASCFLLHSVHFLFSHILTRLPLPCLPNLSSFCIRILTAISNGFNDRDTPMNTVYDHNVREICNEDKSHLVAKEDEDIDMAPVRKKDSTSTGELVKQSLHRHFLKFFVQGIRSSRSLEVIDECDEYARKLNTLVNALSFYDNGCSVEIEKRREREKKIKRHYGKVLPGTEGRKKQFFDEWKERKMRQLLMILRGSSYYWREKKMMRRQQIAAMHQFFKSRIVKKLCQWDRDGLLGGSKGSKRRNFNTKYDGYYGYIKKSPSVPSVLHPMDVQQELESQVLKNEFMIFQRKLREKPGSKVHRKLRSLIHSYKIFSHLTDIQQKKKTQKFLRPSVNIVPKSLMRLLKLHYGIRKHVQQKKKIARSADDSNSVASMKPVIKSIRNTSLLMRDEYSDLKVKTIRNLLRKKILSGNPWKKKKRSRSMSPDVLRNLKKMKPMIDTQPLAFSMNTPSKTSPRSNQASKRKSAKIHAEKKEEGLETKPKAKRKRFHRKKTSAVKSGNKETTPRSKRSSLDSLTLLERKRNREDNTHEDNAISLNYFFPPNKKIKRESLSYTPFSHAL